MLAVVDDFTRECLTLAAYTAKLGLPEMRRMQMA